ncbi:hypothetical protein [Schumannella sp. 10F1B-5-1]|uniref:hypothetical protein n=1 Tax=Schumannella sp. 10F1B-5-1 TaxID=2590780 RepID=UPI00113084E8|nr:hypothetical protein [Schumannella sp. 10F1B-5-1]TPW71611.1 hypothetical protein FJ658_09645 [Schumannella sp. 10F1B-5-1]
MTITTTSPDTIERTALGLRSVLVGALPVSLLTVDAPERYTVEAVFSRRPEREEIDGILAASTRRHLGDEGYPTIELSVSDRRLEISNTNLEELRDGLGTVLAQRLAAISAEVVAARLVAAARAQESSRVEHRRAAAVIALAESISFVR